MEMLVQEKSPAWKENPDHSQNAQDGGSLHDSSAPVGKANSPHRQCDSTEELTSQRPQVL